MIHGGEGEASTGEVCRRAGTYRSLCCQGEIRLATGEIFPPCGRCRESADWTWVGP